MDKKQHCKLGVVQKVLPDHVEVRIERSSACKDCHAKSTCLASDTSSMTISINTTIGETFNIGDKVEILPKFNLLNAVAYAFVFPIVLVLVSLFISSRLEFSEINQMLLLLVLLIVYFLVIKAFNPYFEKRYQYTLKKL